MKLIQFVFCSVLAISQISFAQDGVPPAQAANAVGSGSQNFSFIKGAVGTQSGEYNFYDETELKKSYLDVIKERNGKDYDYFEAARKEIESGIVGLVKSLNKDASINEDGSINVGGLQNMSDNALINEAVDVKAFLKTTREFKSQVSIIQTKIDGITSIAGAFPSQSVTAKGDGADNIPSYGDINFEPLKNAYTNKLIEIVTYTSNLHQLILFPSGTTQEILANTGKSLQLDANDPFVRIDPLELQKLQDEVLSLRTWSNRQQFDKINTFTLQLKQKIQAFMNIYGTTERYRFRDASDTKAASGMIQEIKEAFFLRTYLRGFYGVPIGAIGVSYDKKWANVDYFSTTNTALKEKLISEVLWDENELAGSRDNYKSIMEVAKARASKVFSGNASVIARLNSSITFLTGNRALAETIAAMFELLAADLVEEMEILKGGGKALVLDIFKSRYLGIEEDIIFAKKLISNYDPFMANKSGFVKSRSHMDSGMIGGGTSIKSTFAAALQAVQAKTSDLDKAIAIDDRIQNAMAVSNSVSFGNVAETLSDLFPTN